MSMPLLEVRSGVLWSDGPHYLYCGIILDVDGPVWRCEHEHWEDDAARACAKAQFARWCENPPKSRPVVRERRASPEAAE